ncbi:MAG: hypothetical protein KA369_07480 [Spirochaetes bacterium]|nr:hypothetical protein [Spirochaetota bacterium]
MVISQAVEKELFGSFSILPFLAQDGNSKAVVMNSAVMMILMAFPGRVH